MLVGKITGNLIPEGLKEVDASIGRPGQSIYKESIKLEKLQRGDEPGESVVIEVPIKRDKKIRKLIHKSKIVKIVSGNSKWYDWMEN